MAFIDKENNPVVLNIKLTSKGRELLSTGNLKFKYYAIGDSEIDYTFNAETGNIPAESNILQPLDNNPNQLSFIPRNLSGDPYNEIPSVGSQYLVVNSANPTGFFTEITNSSFTFIDDSNHCKQPNAMVNMSGVIGGNQLILLKNSALSFNGVEPQVDDFVLVKWTLNGNTTTYLTSRTQPTPFLVYQITGIVSGSLASGTLIITVDRELPDFGGTATGVAGAMIYDDKISFSGDTLFNYSPDYLDESVLAFLQNSQCPTVIFPFWNMSIIFTEDIAGVQTGNKTYGQYSSKTYGGFVSYIQNQAPYYKKLGVIHYTNSSPANVYAEGFYLNTPVLDIPTIMWHKSSGSTLGAKFIAGNGYSLTGLNTHYYELVDATNPTVVVGKIFDELKLFVIEDPELLFAMSNKSNRSWTLPDYLAAGGGGCVEPAPIYSLKTIVGSAGQGSIIGTGGLDITELGDITEYGMELKLLSATSWLQTVRGTTLAYNTFSTAIGNLAGNVTYQYRAYVKHGMTLTTGDIQTLTTLAIPVVPVAPSVTYGTTSSIAQTTATGSGTVTSDGGASVTERGIVWSTSPNPTIANSKVVSGSGTGAFTGGLTGLIISTLYYVRAYATNSVGTTYSSPDSTFTTAAAVAVSPTVTTAQVSGIAQTTGTGGGNVTSDGGASVTARGVVWNTSASPTTANSKTTDGTGTGAFTSNLTGLVAGTLYYVRAYATNSVGTSYGNEVSFTTTTAPVAPTVLMIGVDIVTEDRAFIDANVTSDGNSTITERGVVYSQLSGPTTANDKVIQTGTVGTYRVRIDGLANNTLYYVRPYAINAIGTAYGAQESFTTLSPVSVHAVLSMQFVNVPYTTPNQRFTASMYPAINDGSVCVSAARVDGFNNSGTAIASATAGVWGYTAGISYGAGESGYKYVGTDQDPDSNWDQATGYSYIAPAVTVNGTSISVTGTVINVGIDTVEVQFPTSCVHLQT